LNASVAGTDGYLEKWRLEYAQNVNLLIGIKIKNERKRA
jgi:hypothetical protein